MPTGAIHLRDQLSPVNPYTKVRPQPAIAPPPKTPIQRQTAEASQQQKRADHNPNNTQLLTSSGAIQQFETRLDQLQVPELQQPDVTWRQRFVNFVAKTTHLASNAALGKGTTTAEVHGLAGLSGGYAANTPGGVVDISLDGSVDPSASTTEAGIEKWGTSKALSGGSNPAGATLGGLTSLAGLILSGKALKHGIQTFNLGSADANYAAQLRNLHNLLAPDPPGEPNLALARQTLDQDIQVIDQRAQQLEQRAGNNPEDEQFRNEAALLRLREGELRQRLEALGDEEAPPEADNLAQIAQQFNQEAAALDKLAHIKKMRGGIDSFEAAMGLVASGNGLINAIFTGVSIGVPTGETAGNLIANTLIATQAIGGGMAAITGTYGAIKSSGEAIKSARRIIKAHNFINNQDLGNQEGVKKVKDTAQLIKRENQERAMFKTMTAIKSTLMAGAGISLTVGAIGGAAVLAATPIGWAMGGVALVSGVGLGCYKLYQKRSQTQRIGQLEQQNERLKAERIQVRHELEVLNQEAGGLLLAQEQMDEQPIGATIDERLENIITQNQQHLGALNGVIHENQARLAELNVLIPQNEERLAELNVLIPQNEERLAELNVLVPQNEERLAELNVLVPQNEERLAGLNVLIPQNEERLNWLAGEIVNNRNQLEQLSNNPQKDAQFDQYKSALESLISEQEAEQTRLNEQVPLQLAERDGLNQQVAERDGLNQQVAERDGLNQQVAERDGLNQQVAERNGLNQQVAERNGLNQQVAEREGLNQQVAECDGLNQQVETRDNLVHLITQQQQVRADILGKEQEYQHLEDVRAEVKISLRQLSPSAALKTLVNALQGNKGPEAQAAAEALGRELLGIAQDENIDVLHGEPAVVAEVLRKHLGLAYL